MENDYYSKYLKYKTKYIQLKEQMVGASDKPKIHISNCNGNKTTGKLKEGDLYGVTYKKLDGAYEKIDPIKKNGMNQITYINKENLSNYKFYDSCKFIETYINNLKIEK